MEHPALACFARRAEPRARLVCFPHAGGGAHAFATWGELLPEWVEVHAVAYAGRGPRLKEPFAEDWRSLIAECAAAVRTVADRPVALFGHSFGATVAVAVAALLKQEGRAPLRVFASASPPPQAAAPLDLGDLPDAELVAELARRGWLSAAAREAGGAALVTHALPPLRADLGLLDEARAAMGAAAPAAPLTAVGGADDATCDRADLERWAPWTAALTVAVVEGGGHFYVETHAAEAGALVERALAADLGNLPRSIVAGAADLPPMAGATLLEVLELRAGATPDAVAVHAPGAGLTLTFAELRAKSRVVAAAVAEYVAGAAEAVCAVYLPASAEYIVANYAIFAASGAMVYFEVNYTKQLIEDLVEASGARCVLTRASLAENVPEGVPSLLLDAGWEAAAWATAPRSARLPTVADPRALAYCSMSSGTTGKPKAILVEHHSVMHNLRARNAACPYAADGSDVEACNVFFVWESLRAPAHGLRTLVVPSDVVVDSRKLVTFLVRHKATRLMVTPSLLRNLLDTPGLDAARHLGKALRFVMLEGEVVPSTLVDDFAAQFGGSGAVLVNYYSTWESLDATYEVLASGAAAAEKKPTVDVGFFAPVGRPLPRICVFCRDRGTGEVLPLGAPGAVFVVAASLARGYLGDAEKTAARFGPNPLPGIAAADPGIAAALEGAPWALDASLRCYDTGDRGVVLPSGALLLLGRADSTVKIRGFKVALAYVERHVAAAPAVQACVVRPVIDEASQQPVGLAAYVTGDGVDLRDVAAHLRGELPEYAVPSHVVALDAFPTKPGSGKLDFSRLPAPRDEDRTGGAAAAPAAAEPRKPAADVAAPASAFGRVAAAAIAAAFKDALGRDAARDANFFDLGGHSLHAAKVVGAVGNALGVDIAVVDLFERPTVDGLAALLAERRGGAGAGEVKTDRAVRPLLPSGAEAPLDLAMVGAAGYLPGADDLGEFWENLVAAKDALTTLDVGDLRARGVPADLLRDPHFVPAAQKLRSRLVTSFDGFFWGLGQKEVSVMDPQQRKLLEVAWKCREASARKARYGGRGDADDLDDAAVYAASGIDGYLIHHLGGAPLRDARDPGSIWLGETGSEKDYAPVRISYQLGLQGPSVAVGSACSSALVAAALAAQAIGAGECAAALVGAASITFPNLGYKYVDGLVSAVDGRVRPLDAAASGTLFGDGVACCALEVYGGPGGDRPALCVLAGSATTNDGRAKASFTAPSALAQARAIARSTRRARMEGKDLDLLELHATATKVGDAIEVAGVVRALGDRGGADLRLTSVKGNIGHANCAAGLTGLLKAALALAHDVAPPVAHFERLNPKIVALPPGGVVVAPGNGPPPRGASRAGVSSFGVGGTNAHATLRAVADDSAASRGGYGPHAPRDRFRVAATLPDLAEEDEDDVALSAAAYAAMRDAADGAARALGRSASYAKLVADGVWEPSPSPPSLAPAPSPEITANPALRMPSLSRSTSLSPPAGLAPPSLRRAASMAPPPRRRAGLSSLDAVSGRRTPPKRAELLPRTESLDLLRGAPGAGKRAEVLVLSAKTEDALKAMVADVSGYLESADAALADVARTLQEGRFHFPEWRVAVAATTREAAAASLRRAPLVKRAKAVSGGEVCLAIGGNGAGLEFGAGRALFETHAGFRARVRACAAVLDAPLRALPPYETDQGTAPPPDSLLDALGYGDGERTGTFAAHGQSSKLVADLTLSRPAVAEPCAFAVLYALGAVVALGVDGERPLFRGAPYFAAAAGRGVGHLAALALDGALALDDACLLALERGLRRGEYAGFEENLGRKLADRPVAAPKRAPVAHGLRGGWLDALDASEAAYWRAHAEADHNRDDADVWMDNLAALETWEPAAVVAVDVDDDAEGLEPDRAAPCAVGGDRDACAVADCLAVAWASGVDVDWADALAAARGATAEPPPKFVPGVPGYRFADTVHWTNPNASCYAPPGPPDVPAAVVSPAKAAAASRRVVRRSPKPGGPWAARVVCAPYAGGSSAAFGAFRTAAPDWLDVLCVEAPGRGARADDRLCESDADDAAEREALAADLAPMLADGLPYALLGLSAGVLLSLELLPLLPAAPAALVLAGRCPPRPAGGAPFPVPDDAEILDVYALAPPEVLASRAFRDVALPRLRADLAADARAEARVAAAGLAGRTDAPLTVLCGADDASFGPARVAEWFAATSSRESASRVAPGGHDFLTEDIAAIAGDVAAALGHFAPPVRASYAVGWGRVEAAAFDGDGEARVVRAEALGAAPLPAGGTVVVDALSLDLGVAEETALAARLVDALRGLAAAGRRTAVVVAARASARGSIVAGATKCAAYEAPELACRRAYVRAPRAAVAGLGDAERRRLARFCAAASAGELDCLLAPAAGGTLEGGAWTRAAARAEPAAPGDRAAAAARARAALPARGRILVTGASGGLGTILVDWLLGDVGVAPERLVLVARRAEPLAARRPGCSVVAVPDATAPGAWAGVPPCAFAFHLAGALKDATLANCDAATFAVPVGPKAGALESLRAHAAAQRWPLKCVVAYSSTTSLYGFPGQTNYGAANSYLDAAADFGDDDDDDAGEALPPVLAVHWGPWGGSGMAAEGTKAWDVAMKVGDRPLPPDAALEALADALAAHPRGGARRAIFLVADWAKSPWRKLKAAAHLVPPEPATQVVVAIGDDAAKAFLEGRVSSWLPGETLSALGLDSLDLAEMRAAAAELGKGLPPADLFADPEITLGDLADRLRAHLGVSAAPAGDPARDFLEGRVSSWMPAETLSALGLDSLDLAEMRAAAAELGKGLPPADLFADPEITLGDLADKLRRHLGVAEPPPAPPPATPPPPAPPLSRDFSSVGSDVE